MSSTPPSDLAYHLLRLEQQLESYRRLHDEELEQIRLELAELKAQVLASARRPEAPPAPDPDAPKPDTD